MAVAVSLARPSKDFTDDHKAIVLCLPQGTKIRTVPKEFWNSFIVARRLRLHRYMSKILLSWDSSLIANYHLTVYIVHNVLVPNLLKYDL